MNCFERNLQERLGELRANALLRHLRRVDSPQAPRLSVAGEILLNFSSNDYLGLANEPLLKEAAIRALEQFGAGSGASRLVCGSLAPHHELEEALAEFKGTEAALTFSSGYAAATGTICALLGSQDILILDKRVHASIVDAARLSGARLRVFPHNDLNALESMLQWALKQRERTGDRRSKGQTMIVTESVFSMDGDIAPLREIVALKERYDAWLMIDEAHATGIYGPRRRGLAEQFAVSDRVEVQLGTLGKAFGASGGYICGSRVLIDFLMNRARSFVFSTAPVPAAAAAACAAVRLVSSDEGERRRETLWHRIAEFRSQVSALLPEPASAIVPWIVGSEPDALAMSEALLKKEIFIPAIRYPTVARGAARLRITLTAAHAMEDIRTLASELNRLAKPAIGSSRNAPTGKA